ncbi:hypothetical protein FG05_35425 [Fusarium graminearum]|nr:hypothetical protein FG05_35425 [Fusarium graminearum]
MPRIVIRWESIEQWEATRQQVDQTLEKYTGTSEYPSTKSLPPIMIGAEVPQDGIDELKVLNGVIVETQDDD